MISEHIHNSRLGLLGRLIPPFNVSIPKTLQRLAAIVWKISNPKRPPDKCLTNEKEP